MTDAQVSMTSVSATSTLSATVMATSGRGFNPEEIGHMLIDKVFYIGPNLSEEVRAQAVAQRNQLYAVFVHYLTIAQKSQNTTVYNQLKEAGFDDAAEYVKGL